MSTRWRRIATASLLAFLAAVGGGGARRIDDRLVSLIEPSRPRAAVSRRTRLDIEPEYPTQRILRLQIEEHYPSQRTAQPTRPAQRLTQLDIEPDFPRRVPDAHVAAIAPRAPARRAAPPALEPLPPLVALTFDTEIPHGAEARRTLNAVLDTLRDAHVRATFFVVGWWARANPDVLRRIVAEGHQVANHTLTHAPFAARAPAALQAELRQVADIVLRETGTPIAPLFRPPYGCIDDPAAQLAERAGYQLTGWTAYGKDARGATQYPAQVLSAVGRDLRPGAIVLLHTNHWVTAQALPDILRMAQRGGLAAVTLSELFERSPLRLAREAKSRLRTCGGMLRASAASHDAKGS